MTALTWLYFVAGIALLLGGAEWLVRGAARLARASGISPLVVGLTVVAFGTSAPELAVSVQSALAGQPDIALGNVVGSNILNVLLILGVAALITPLTVAQQLIRLDVPLMIGISGLVYVLALDGRIGPLEGVLLVACIVAYTVFAIVKSRRESAEIRAEYAAEFGTNGRGGILKNLLLVIAGLILLVLGARWLVEAATTVARHFGLSELVIGLTVVAVGTSLPEVVASVLASVRGERDIAVGNVVGSNLFNLTAVLGLASTLAPAGIPVTASALSFDLPVMLAVALACLPIFFTEHRIARWEGALFLGYYAAYTAYLVLYAVQHDALAMFSATLLGFVLPLTAVTLIVLAVRALRAKRGMRSRARAEVGER
jgi:cation:H+ antiporter